MFIQDFITSVYSELEEYVSNNGCICKLKTINFSGGNIPDYTSKEVQLLYHLRYTYAYAFEYKGIYKDLFNKIPHISNAFNILSIGCGSGIDAWSAGAALESLDNAACWGKINYQGIDRIDWYKKIEASNINISHVDLTTFLCNNSIAQYDVIIFPKSISEITGNTFSNLCNVIRTQQINKSRLYLLVNLRATNYYMNQDMEKTSSLINAFKSVGFKTNDSAYSYTRYVEEYKDKQIAEIDTSFSYPYHIRKFLSQLHQNCNTYIKNENSCLDECETILSRWPVTKPGIIKYQIITFER